MTPEQLIERVKSLGVEFWQPSETLEAMLKQTEAARIMRIDRLKDFVRINAERLAKLKEVIRTLPEQIAKWEAERAHLEASTAVGLVMGQEVPKPAAVEVLPEFRAIKDIPYAMFKAYDGVWLDPAGNRVANVMDPERQIRPRDTTFTELVEAMADAREKQGDPEPPALLDLRGLKVGTVCEADADFELPETGTKVHEGERFTVIQHDPHDDTMSARIEVDEEHWWSRALVPARVVEKGGEDAQG